jgi:hypothetical protein
MQAEYQLANPKLRGIRGFSSGFTGFQGKSGQERVATHFWIAKGRKTRAPAGHKALHP